MPGRAESRLLIVDDVPGNHGHRHGRRVPAARRDTAEVRLRCLLVGEVKGLRIVLTRELQHFLAGDFVGAELGLGADHQVFEIDHGRAHSGARLARVRLRLGSDVATQSPIRSQMAPAPDRGSDGAQREPARRRRAAPEAAPQGRPVRRRGDPHARRARGADRPVGAMPRTCFAGRSRLRPAWTRRKANLALVLGRTGRPAEAMELLDEIFADEPEDLGIWNLKAATLGRLGDFERGDRALRGGARSARRTSRGSGLATATC